MIRLGPPALCNAILAATGVRPPFRLTKQRSNQKGVAESIGRWYRSIANRRSMRARIETANRYTVVWVRHGIENENVAPGPSFRAAQRRP
jgi:hypothetical protein